MSGTTGNVETDAQLLSEAADGQAAGSYTLQRLRNIIASETRHIQTIPSTVQAASYTLALTDAGTVVEMNSATGVTLTVPLNASVAFPIGMVIEVCQVGAGTVTFAPAGGVTLRTSTNTLTTRTQYSTVSLRQRATDEWVIAGDLT